MLQLPVPSRISRNFLDGNGNFQLETDNDAWKAIVEAKGSFDKETDTVADVTLGGGATRDFTFGRQNDFKLLVKVDAQLVHQVQVLWPDRDADLARQYGISIGPKHLCARVVIHAKAEGTANADFPTGPLSVTAGIAAGGTVAYERWITRNERLRASSILGDLYQGIRLPQHVDEISEIPAPGELLVSRFGGYLRLNAGLSWGYSVTGTRNIGVNNLKLDLEYRLRTIAAISLGYKLAGEFQIEARPGSEQNWCRFVVRKSRESQASVAADFAWEADIEAKGLPESADDFLSKLIGTHADRMLELFHDVRRYTNLEDLENAAGRLLMVALRKYSQEALGIALANQTVQQFVLRMQQIANAYANLDRRIIDLYHTILEAKEAELTTITTALDLVLGAGSREQLLSLTGTPGFSGVIDLLRRFYNEQLFDVLQKNENFTEALQLLGQAKRFIDGEADAEIKKWIDLLKQEFPLDKLLAKLSTLKTEADIRALADEKLKGLVESLVGKAFDQLKKTDVKELLDILGNNLSKVENFKNKWYERLREEVKQSFQAKLHLAYTRARRNEKLLDVEINLAHEKGQKLARLATRGDFHEVLNSYDATVVRLRQGMFRDQLESATEVKVNVLGWGLEGIVTLVREVDHAIEAQGSGLLHVYTARTYVERKKKSGWRFKEEMYSKFLLTAVAEQSQAQGEEFKPMGASLIKALTGDYRLMEKDEDTSVEELTQHLRFAALLGLLREDPASYARQLAEDCGGELGAVKVDYRVKFSHQDLLTAFRFSDANDPDGGELGKLIRVAMRDFILHKYGAMPSTHWLARVGFAYCSEIAYRWHRSASLRNNLKSVFLPAWFIGQKKPIEVSIPGNMVELVQTLFNYEDSLVEAMQSLKRGMDRVRQNQKVRFGDFKEAIDGLIESAKNLGGYDASCLPAILDRLIQLATGGTASRDTIMILEVKPRSGPLFRQTVTRVLAASPKTTDVVAADTVLEDFVSDPALSVPA